MNSLPSYSPEQLVAQGFDLEFPCRIEGLIGLHDLIALERLRLIPDKRIVFLATTSDKNIVVKLVKGQRRQKQQCAAEERGIIALETLGVETQKFFSSYWGEATDVGYIATNYIDNAHDLHTVWLHQSDQQRAALLEQVMQIFCKMHDGGVFQDDAHLSNFLWQDGVIYAIDGATVNTTHRGKSLGLSDSLDNLAVFFGQLYPSFDRLIPDALEYYRQHRNGLTEPVTLEALEQRLASFRENRMAVYLKKVFRQSTSHICLHNWQQYVVYAREQESQMLKDFIRDPDAFVDRGEMLKKGNTSTVVKTLLNGKPCVIKRYNIKSFMHGILRAIQPSRAWISWRNAHMLKTVGIPTPEPVLMYETRRGPLRSKAYFICEAVGESTCFADLIEQGMTREQGEALFEPLFDAFQRSRITHGDMKATNFFVHDGVVTPIDIDGMRWHHSASSFEKAFAKDKARFYKNWGE